MYKIKLIASIMVIFSLMVGTSFSDPKRINGSPLMPLAAHVKLPKHYPSYNKMLTGKITHVFKKSKVIELDGITYQFHPIHDIYTKRKGVQAALYNLKPGIKVGLEFTTYQGKNVANKIWILPGNYPTSNFAN